ncbi:MAG: mce8D [Nocardia sp.]|uniref:MlaD family protein n=1 Tax=Nocardia sp. TaxID=1821 RepID=UPI002606B830|nr:MlaD family protein [Nocardia sp.]MCU1639970.1 mce8D [Nocardia sp.]
MKRILATRGFVSVAGAAVLAAVVVLGYFVVANPTRPTRSYCAIMPDAVGLYPHNHVTIRGIPVGAVTRIQPDGTGVRVDFDIDAEYPPHGEVSATTVSDTLLADRNLAVLGDDSAPQPWPTGQCITKTFTPKSLSESLGAFSKLSHELGDGDTPGSPRIQQSVAAVEAATSGTGPALNTLINQLGAVLRAPDAAIGHIGALIDSIQSLADSVDHNWDDLKLMIVNAKPGVDMINSIWTTSVGLLTSMGSVFTWLNEIIREYGRPILGGMDSAGPDLKLLSAQIGTMQQLVGMIPPIVGAFQQVIDPQSGQVRVTYAQPAVALPQPNADQVCGVLNALAPGGCTDGADGLAHIPLVPLVLGVAGAGR